jgi:biopolymer transport protein TolQ
MHSFHNIGLEGKATLATVAPGISEALLATALGLFVAIPATVGYNHCLNRLNVIESELVNFAGVFLNRVQREINAATTRAVDGAKAADKA